VVAAGDSRNDAEKLGITHGMVVQELGWDEDVDDELRATVEQQCGGELVDEESDEVVDVALLWWRDGDGDLVDALVDAIGPLADDGAVWVLSPKTGKSGHVEPSEIAEAAPTAGLTQTLTMNLGDWAANRLVQPKARGRR
jgi:threonine dehydrogenase-like Zn-dependent dehydrogenase